VGLVSLQVDVEGQQLASRAIVLDLEAISQTHWQAGTARHGWLSVSESTAGDRVP
jgi:hypothetical protein